MLTSSHSRKICCGFTVFKDIRKRKFSGVVSLGSGVPRVINDGCKRPKWNQLAPYGVVTTAM